MFKLMLVMLTLGGPNEDYDHVQRYNDSLLIYNTYRTQAKMLKALKPTELQAWYRREANDDSLTACAKLRLKKFNHQSYNPSETYERKEMGLAYAYPAPSTVEHETSQAFAKASAPNFHFIVYDKQTYFMLTDKIGKIIPYVKRLIFDKGRLLYTEKLNPVTLEKLIIGEAKEEGKEVVILK